MKDADAIRILTPALSNAAMMFSVIRTKRRSFIAELVDTMLSGGVIGDLHDLNENTSTPMYLLIDGERSSIARIDDASILSNAALPAEAAVPNRVGKKFTDGEYMYRLTARIK